MDIKAYIESGIIESYVLGLASPEEAGELETLSLQNPEIKQAIESFETLIEKQAFDNAVAPSPNLKDKIFSALSTEFEQPQNNSDTITPVIPLHAESPNVIKIFPIQKYFAVASFILLLGSAALNIYLYDNYLSTSNKYQTLLAERNTLQASNDVYRTKLDILQNPDMKVVPLNPQPGKENNLAAVYWNTKTKDVYLLPTGMEPAPSDKQYQLWAIVDGKPVSAGVIENCNGVCKMSNIPKAQAFAITLEKMGGSDQPTMPIYVLGNT